MEELYRIIEQKIKDAGYPRAISGETEISATKLKEKKMALTFYFPRLKMMLFLNIILL